MKGIIIYKGKYGATEQYAQWLGKELQLPVHVPGDTAVKTIAMYDYVILGSSVYVGKLQLRNWIKEHVPELQHKKVFVFIVCGTPAEEKDKIEKLANDNIPAAIRNQCSVFFLRGRMILQRLSRWDRFMLKMGARLTKDPAARQGMIKDFDYVNIKSIGPLVQAVNAFARKEPITAEAQ
jgi:menaquinone-dependent protoporphyrinogen IX oxidase